jgi:hypothetical protein
VHEVVALELLAVLLENPTDDSVEVHSSLRFSFQRAMHAPVCTTDIVNICLNYGHVSRLTGGCGVCEGMWSNTAGLNSSRTSW